MSVVFFCFKFPHICDAIDVLYAVAAARIVTLLDLRLPVCKKLIAVVVFVCWPVLCLIANVMKYVSVGLQFACYTHLCII